MRNPWLSIPKPIANVNVLRVDESCPVDAFWAVDPAGRFLFLVEGLAYDADITLPSFDAIQCAVVHKQRIGDARLVIQLNDSADWELFFALCSDLVRTLGAAGPQQGLAFVAARLAKWLVFLRSGRERVLSKERIRGLFGELTLLADGLAPALGWRTSVEAWGGPFGAKRDFVFTGTEIEVKAKLAGTGREVRISSEDQLASPTGDASLFLHVATLATATPDTAGAESLASLVKRIRLAVEADSCTADAFEDRLLAAGYADTTAYEDERFSIESEEVFRVVEGFPRLVPEILPAGVRHISYGLDLGSCGAFSVDTFWGNQSDGDKNDRRIRCD